MRKNIKTTEVVYRHIEHLKTMLDEASLTNVFQHAFTFYMTVVSRPHEGFQFRGNLPCPFVGTSPHKRLNITLSQDLAEEIESFVQATGEPLGYMLRLALEVYGSFLWQQVNGRPVVMTRPDGTECDFILPEGERLHRKMQRHPDQFYCWPLPAEDLSC